MYQTQMQQAIVGKFIQSFLLMSILLAGCWPQPTPTPIPSAQRPTKLAEPTPSLTQQAEAALREYYSALQERNYAKAASLLSVQAGMDRRAIAQLWEDMDKQGWRLTRYEITGSQPFDNTRVIFKVTVQQEGPDPGQYDSSNIMRLEDGRWYFAAGILDKFTFLNEPDTINGITVYPGLMLRGIDKITIWMRLDNVSDKPAIWGSTGAVCGIIYFRDEPVNAPCTPSGRKLKPFQSTNTSLEFLVDALKRLPDDLPTVLEVTQLQWDADDDNVPDPTTEPWSYHFRLKYVSP